jgi:Ankyrin repeat.
LPQRRRISSWSEGQPAIAWGDSVETAAALARKGTQPNTLERAVWTQDRELTHALLKAGADPNALSSGNRAPLIVAAAMQGDPEIIENLISHGANVNAASETKSPHIGRQPQSRPHAARTRRE